MATVWTKLSVATNFGGVTPDITMLRAEIVADDTFPVAVYQDGVVLGRNMTLATSHENYVDADAVCFPTDQAPSAAELTALAAVATAHTPPTALARNKTTRAAEVDERTKALIAAGFTNVASGKTMSASLEDGLAYIAYSISPGAFPLKFKNIDNTDASISLADQAAIDTLVDECAAHLKTHRESGRALVASIVAAADQAALDAIVDTR